ncbi:hypothetical protein [Dyella japonica]|uniref:Uncharacterized protein n=3 Tax=root TaxID=1 RepID=A0A3G3MCH1_9CAUD|nr:hypothetical protein [Dyella japonica]AYR04192.1 hypothetical protein [Escherichia phage OLB145]KLD61791.1 hypothetical protein Y882_18880 [Dyella japonica DSM 16301]QDF14907.1 hypothetical protein AC3HA13_090 [Escherichia phage vB_EcoP_3HA13]
MNQIIAIPQHKARIADRNIRIHYPMPLSNPFQKNERTTDEDIAAAYEAYLRNRLVSGDKLITAEMERIAKFVMDATDKPVGLIGNELEVNVIRKIIMEALNGNQ